MEEMQPIPEEAAALTARGLLGRSFAKTKKIPVPVTNTAFDLVRELRPGEAILEDDLEKVLKAFNNGRVIRWGVMQRSPSRRDSLTDSRGPMERWIDNRVMNLLCAGEKVKTVRISNEVAYYFKIEPSLATPYVKRGIHRTRTRYNRFVCPKNEDRMFKTFGIPRHLFKGLLKAKVISPNMNDSSFRFLGEVLKWMHRSDYLKTTKI